MRRELWFGFGLMAMILAAVAIFMPAPAEMTDAHLGLLMLSLIVVTIMLGFPTAFTLMGMGVVFAWLAYRSVDPDTATALTLNLMVYRAYAVMTNDVLIAIPLFVFMGYLVERANLIERLFRSIHLALAWVPGSLAVATLVTSALFATATGIIGAVVTLMGLLALPAMLKAGYGIRLSTGSITAGGCLGILIPPSVLLILYGATAGVSVVQLYAGAFFPGLMLAGLYVIYVIVIAKLRPQSAPPLPEHERRVELPPDLHRLQAKPRARALPALIGMLVRPPRAEHARASAAGNLIAALFPALLVGGILYLTYSQLTYEPAAVEEITLQPLGYSDAQLESYDSGGTGLAEPPGADMESRYGPSDGGLLAEPAQVTEENAEASRGAPTSFWIVVGIFAAIALLGYAAFTFERLVVLRMLLTSFFPLAFMIAAVLGTIVFGLATPAEAAAAGAVGGYALTAAYQLAGRPRPRVVRILLTWLPLLAVTIAVFGAKLVFDWYPPRLLITAAWISLAAVAILAYIQLGLGAIVRESVFLTARTTAMVCWLFVGSSIFSAAFALLGGQALIEDWVLSLELSPLQFLILAQLIIFLLGWPLEWTEIIVIFMPIFIPLLAHFNVDPLFFGLLVALNLQTAFLSPPVAMAAFYLKGVAPPHVSLNQIFAGVIPFMVIQVIAIVLLYVFPQIGLWLPRVLYS
jgi:TRAP-type mannitol/chloroaromatic compound transport system permease large subunit